MPTNRTARRTEDESTDAPNTRTTVTIRDDLLKQVKELAHTNSVTDAITWACEQVVASESRRRLASLLGSDDSFEAAPRRKPE